MEAPARGDPTGSLRAGPRPSDLAGWQAPDPSPRISAATRPIEQLDDGWALAMDGAASAAYVRAETRKGGARFGVVNWAMVSASGPFAGGRSTVTAMGSLETLTLGECGFPGLLASVSTCPINAVRDFQHPHPPLMELSARQSWPLRGPVSLDLLGAVVGEPALGPTQYLHRRSAALDPVAPISAHETNPAHASSGVLTAGLRGSGWSLEGSIFDGEPPDPDRVVPEPGPLDAAAGRISLNLSPMWAMQASYGRIPGSAGHHTGAGGAIRSLIASLTHVREMGEGGTWATTAIFAHMEDGTLPRNSLLLEGTAATGPYHSWFGRIELADRLDSRMTIIEHPDGSHDHLVDHERVRVAQLAAGYLFHRTYRGAFLGTGVRGSISLLPKEFRSVYETRWPTSFSLFLSVRPAPRGNASHHHH